MTRAVLRGAALVIFRRFPQDDWGASPFHELRTGPRRKRTRDGTVPLTSGRALESEARGTDGALAFL